MFDCVITFVQKMLVVMRLPVRATFPNVFAIFAVVVRPDVFRYAVLI